MGKHRTFLLSATTDQDERLQPLRFLAVIRLCWRNHNTARSQLQQQGTRRFLRASQVLWKRGQICAYGSRRPPPARAPATAARTRYAGKRPGRPGRPVAPRTLRQEELTLGTASIIIDS